MDIANNQDGVLALWRANAAKDDPPFYSAKKMLGRTFVWMNVVGNVGWYAPEMKGEEVIGLRSISLPQPSGEESQEDRAALNYVFRWVNPKQRRKLAQLLKTQCR